MEFLFADALNKKCDTIFTCGGVQSNHCRATAVAAIQLGLDCYLFLRSSEQVSYIVCFLAMYRMNTFLHQSPLLDALDVWPHLHINSHFYCYGNQKNIPGARVENQ